MAGWDDVNLPGEQTLGALTAGYIIDIPLIDTYIRAINEKGRLFFPQANLIPPIDRADGKPYVWRFSVLQDIIKWYGILMKDFVWVRQDAFDDPMITTSIYDEDLFKWTEEDLIGLVGEDIYDILCDPFDTQWTLKQLQSAPLFNAMYTLYSEVFLVTEKQQLEPLNYSYDLYRSWPIGLGGYNLAGRLEFDNEGDAKNRMDVTAKDIYDERTYGRTISHGPPNFMFQSIHGAFSHRVPSVVFKAFNTGASATNRRTEAIHRFRNDSGEFVKLDISMSVYIGNNFTRDRAISAGDDWKPDVYSPRNTDLPLVSNGSGVFRMTSPPPDDSFVDEDGWRLQFWGSIPLDYNLKMSDFHYDYDALAPPTGPPTNHQSSVSKASSFFIGHNYDIYYNTNVEAMLYNTLPEEEEEP